MTLRALVGVLGFGAAVLLAGCGGAKGPAAATVSGEVKLNGVPVEKGVISYTPTDGTGAPATAEIKKGRYEIATTAGSKMVLISAPVAGQRQKDQVSLDTPMIESIPEKYNAKSELTFDVVAGSNSKDWDLDSKKK